MAKPAEIKTKETDASVEAFINTVADEQKRKDSFAILKLMEKASRSKAKMWGASLIGFGNKRYKSPSGREVDWFIIGFSPRKANFSLYLTTNIGSHDESLLKKLGKYKTGGGCIYINKLADVDLKVLETMFKLAVEVNSRP